MADAERNRSAGVGHSEQILRDVAAPVLAAAICSVVWLLFLHGYKDVFGEGSFIFAGYALALVLLSTGILYRAVYPRLGFVLQFIGITIILLYFCGVVRASLPKPFFVVISSLLLLPFFYALLIKP